MDSKNDSNLICDEQFNNEKEFWIKNYLSENEYLHAIMPSTPILTKLNYRSILSVPISSIYFGNIPPSPITDKRKEIIKLEKRMRKLNLEFDS